MKCPYCGCENLLVVDSRIRKNNTIHRRRHCQNCGGRFNTSESICKNPDGDPKPPKKTIVLATGSDMKHEFVLVVRMKKEAK